MIDFDLPLYVKTLMKEVGAIMAVDHQYWKKHKLCSFKKYWLWICTNVIDEGHSYLRERMEEFLTMDFGHMMAKG